MGYPTTVDTGQVTPWLLGAPEINSAASNGVLAANSVYLYVFELMAPVTVTSMRWRMGATATGTSDLGIYDGNGNLLGHTGASTNTASTLMTVALTGGNLALSPGRYSLALCPYRDERRNGGRPAGDNGGANQHNSLPGTRGHRLGRRIIKETACAS